VRFQPLQQNYVTARPHKIAVLNVH